MHLEALFMTFCFIVIIWCLVTGCNKEVKLEDQSTSMVHQQEEFGCYPIKN